MPITERHTSSIARTTVSRPAGGREVPPAGTTPPPPATRAVAGRVAGLLACLAVAVVWLSPPAQADPDPDATDSASLRGTVDRRQEEVAAARSAVDAAAVAAADALETYTNAVRREEAAHAEAERLRGRLEAAEARLAVARADIGRWARTAYAGGDSYLPGAGLATVLRGSTTDDLGATVATLRRVGEHRSHVVDEFTAAELERREASDAAAAAAEAAETAAGDASRAHAAADAALRQQRQVLAAGEAALAQARDAATLAERREQLATGAAGSGGNVVTGPVGSCAGGDIGRYPNGMIPIAALCQLAAQPGHYLRADAAAAFDRMSRAYAARFGVPLCVTDSYRTYEEQVRLKSEKPALAATPGTSNHGWGTATDLCGGVESFGTPQHAWLATNAPLHNWFHPSWAREGGSKPEPWHFEYAG